MGKPKENKHGFFRKHGGKIIFGLITLIVALIVIPVVFNYAFMWDSGLSRGKPSDWFVFYGSIFGGLIGGFFTYLSLLLTFNNEKKKKQEEMRPRIDIPYKSFEFIDGENLFEDIVIELNNIGGTIAKNIECQLSLPNFDEVMSSLENSKNELNITLLSPKAIPIDEVGNEDYITEDRKFLIVPKADGTGNTSLGGIEKEYNSEFIGSCIPLTLNHEANAKYILEPHVSNWINYIVRNRKYTGTPVLNENELFEMELKVNYSSIEYGDFTDYFLLKWKYIGAVLDQKIRYQYVLKSETMN